jgi:KaiC/GvpD/RAD55 family RecA-like ATPase
MIKKLIQPEHIVGNYYLIVGESGTGKTTLVQLAIKDLPEPKGVFYVDIPNDSELESRVVAAFQDAIGWHTSPKETTGNFPILSIVISTNRSIDLLLRYVWDEIIRASRKYNAQNGKAPTIIIDNCDSLLEQAPKLLYLLQDNAKTAADNHELKRALISSEPRMASEMKNEYLIPPTPLRIIAFS